MRASTRATSSSGLNGTVTMSSTPASWPCDERIPGMTACNVAAAQCSAAEDEPDPSKSRVRVRVDLHPLVAFAHPGGLPGPVLRFEGDLGELRTAREHAPADLVDQVLDRAA